MIVEPLSVVLARLADLVDVGNEWAGAQIRLFQAGFTPNRGMTFADLVAAECDFDGYAESSAIVFGTPYADALNRAVLAGGSKQFTCTGATTSNDVGGYAVVNAAGDAILWAEEFTANGMPAPIRVNAANQAITIVPQYTQGGLAA